MSNKVQIKRLVTGIPGLDSLFGGGIPEFSFNLIAGTPGSGKTTLAHQMMFALTSTESRALFFTVLGEPSLKMLRYQQQFSFYDLKKQNESIRYVNLADDIMDGDYDRVLARILAEVKAYSPSFVFVDSFRSIVQAADYQSKGPTDLQHFVQRLSMQMTSWQATTFLIGEYMDSEAQTSPVYTIADGIVWLVQSKQRNSVVRKVQVVKMRGQANSQGAHTFRIDNDGVHVFPRAMVDPNEVKRPAARIPATSKRLSTGVAELDAMLGGGIPAGYSTLLVGPSGSGKTVLATEFLAEGVRIGEAGVIAAFEKSPNQLLSQKLDDLVQSGQVGLIDTHSLDLSIDETLHDLVSTIQRLNAKRVVIDSLSGFELALAPAFQEDFRESLYRLVAVLTGMGVTVLMTTELEDRYGDLRFSPYGNAFLADAIILQRYIELEGEFKRVISVVKVRGSKHSKAIRLFDIEDDAVVIGDPLSHYEGILTGKPTSMLRGGLTTD
ncbi:ATPase domain-containing protein [Noviherbaspirillum denitrificans]|uniref:non-specific serine/threonine protein kinase n=1 Tax=Noviherbaspirillum denitrificans TaxID=1968433 RepID=A0A254T6J5_9BURK|nr:ATPase domain-containing protein [Noviherbaspirillum denitrificans]OWW18284.1 protein kinase [Noviherbaspirillum denitrificans]